jgi:hypothetical protein
MTKLGKTSLNLIQILLTINSQLTQLDTLSEDVNNLIAMITTSHGHISSAQPSHQEGVDSSHPMTFHSNPLTHDPCLPKVEVNKFDGSEHTGWVTQMEHYFSLHNIIDDLIKLCIDVLYLDPERWKWWQWRKNSHRGYISWNQFVANLYEIFDIDTHHLGRLTKLKQSGTVEEYITSFEKLDF